MLNSGQIRCRIKHTCNGIVLDDVQFLGEYTKWPLWLRNLRYGERWIERIDYTEYKGGNEFYIWPWDIIHEKFSIHEMYFPKWLAEQITRVKISPCFETLYKTLRLKISNTARRAVYICRHIYALCGVGILDEDQYKKDTMGLLPGPLTRYVKSRVVNAPGMPGTFSPPPTSKGTAS